ncbi:MAG: hypothetical protein HRU11_04835 [Parvularculaceae bacterium]|nr:hypothetical protein [Parvularculaceae bacterium]
MVSEQRQAGALLFIGVLLIVGSILGEFAIGWGSPSRELPLAERVARYAAAWPTLRWLFAGQMAGVLLQTAASFLLLASNRSTRALPPQKIVLAVTSVAGVMVVLAFAISLGAYPAAFAVVDTSPEIIAVLFGQANVLYQGFSALMALGFLTVFVQEGVSKDGCVGRGSLLVILGLLVGGFVVPALGLMSGKTTGVVFFVVPAWLGLSWWGQKKPA